MSHCLEFEELKRAGSKLLPFTNMINGLREEKDSLPLDQFYDLVAERSGYVRHLEEKDREEDRDRLRTSGAQVQYRDVYEGQF
jgi:superfamily I DNA/RNA helicase